MDQERKPLMAHEIDSALAYFRKRGLDEEVMRLIEDDLKYGLKTEEIKKYASRKLDYPQMCVVSKCLRYGCDDEALSVIAADGMGHQQMEIAFAFYRKGIAPDTIRDVVLESEKVPYRMERAFKSILEKQEEAKKIPVSGVDRDYVDGLMKQIGELVDKIRFQDERYDELNRQLGILQEDESIRQNLIDQNAEKDQLLNSQQDELNRANSAISRLRNEKEAYEKEAEKMRERIAQLEEQAAEKTGHAAEGDGHGKEGRYADTEEEDVSGELPEKEAYRMHLQGAEQRKPDGTYHARQEDGGIPVYYRVPVVDEQGQVIRHVTVERSKRKSGGVMEALSRLCFMKKSHADIVRLVSSGNLVPAQLVQIKNAIRRGLTEDQLEVLVSNNVSAEKMKEIIEIAVLENSMAR